MKIKKLPKCSHGDEMYLNCEKDKVSEIKTYKRTDGLHTPKCPDGKVPSERSKTFKKGA